MSSRPPPLSALRAFSSLARLGSVSAAAEELNLTPGAITHQIRALEAELEVPLVVREGRSLSLTEHGRNFGYQVRLALEDIANATENIRNLRCVPVNDGPVRVAVLPSFAQTWLLPRLPIFCRLYPGIRFHFDVSNSLTDVNAGDVHCAIRFGHGQWPDVSIRPLMGDSLLMIGSPKLIGARRPDTLAELFKFPWLHSSENWAGWVSSMDVPMDEDAMLSRRPKPRMEFSDSTHLLEAVRQGLGIALTRRTVADQMLQSGEVVQVFDHECPHAYSYSALLPRSAPRNAAAYQFLDWLGSECTQFAHRHNWRPLYSEAAKFETST